MGDIFEGSIIAVDSESLIVELRDADDSSRVAVPFNEILEMRCRDPIKDGMAKGYLAGTVLGTLGFSYFLGGMEGSTSLEAVVLGGLLGSTITGPIGLIVGGAVDRQAERRIEINRKGGSGRSIGSSKQNGRNSCPGSANKNLGPYFGLLIPFEGSLERIELYGLRWIYFDESGVVYELSAQSTGKAEHRWISLGGAFGMWSKSVPFSPYILAGLSYDRLEYFMDYVAGGSSGRKDVFMGATVSAGCRIDLSGGRLALTPEYSIQIVNELYQSISLGLGFIF